MRSSAWVRATLASIAVLSVSPAHAQEAADQAIDAIRRLANVGPNDQRQIKNWIDIQVDRLVRAPQPDPARADGFNAGAFKTLRTQIQRQLGNDQNTPAFVAQFAHQMAIVAADRFSQPNAGTSLVRGVARALVDINRVETVPGLVAGLKVADQGARYLCAEGLFAQQASITNDAALLPQVIQSLGVAGQTEGNAAVLGRIYEALGFSSQVAVVFPVYMDIFDTRLQDRQTRGAGADAAEVFAFEFFRDVVASVNEKQRGDLAKRLAVFLRLDATRYNDTSLATPVDAKAPDLGYREREVLERRLDACEALLETLVGAGRGGNIRDQLNREGHDARQGVVEETYKWIGDAETNVTGALNAAPWNVPVGAPSTP